MPLLSPTPTAPFSDKIASLGRMLAACPIFRAQSGLAVDDPAAEEKLLGEESEVRRIFYPQKDDAAISRFPAAVISPMRRRYAAFGDGTQTAMAHDKGILLLIVLDEDHTEDLEADPPVDFDLEKSSREFENFWGLMVAQLAAQSGQDWDAVEFPDEPYSRLRIACIDEDQPPELTPVEQNKRYWLAAAHVFYGLWPELELIR